MKALIILMMATPIFSFGKETVLLNIGSDINLHKLNLSLIEDKNGTHFIRLFNPNNKQNHYFNVEKMDDVDIITNLKIPMLQLKFDPHFNWSHGGQVEIKSFKGCDTSDLKSCIKPYHHNKLTLIRHHADWQLQSNNDIVKNAYFYLNKKEVAGSKLYIGIKKVQFSK